MEGCLFDQSELSDRDLLEPSICTRSNNIVRHRRSIMQTSTSYCAKSQLDDNKLDMGQDLAENI